MPIRINLNKEFLSLDQLKPGEIGMIQDYKGMGEISGRIKELGLIRGSLVLVKKYAPFNDPLEIVVRGSHLSLRKKEASQIVVIKVLPKIEP
ncbi:MAG: hypothetical protein A3G33_04680 [Omnitrophica bacterium RIFCSPLOWO2_12_FULL_44_17]|uniref:Ferrous iron transporter FeoA-like domain-containing protein n=1 Tax=Candidatus Danuiimicrobium aquiferis TaxID=1801832 RepID=A0A1G1KRQ0_9BACT|nr:MAG: hypothetical protein A3B72_10890 [Omnitrophica bacterium RIFCSPHIGHO2_02_FULL_45_28]OGW89382.1 MAG: hypothetical protein A3E74_02515 [Omnitrophica bacterium RIFCSPHIGHO2_12_FULL_44_12]OGW95229.1 MAG: hypothetical protein A3G33_04680 [Omnitrophica bacterium RIFCSPLOWO2_12_FULL_44_17]OGX02325.1 MAG: hypothetical protein A3J12_10005 [Omnitrophica bacterium RIFCSPLOWO2_02_FULL_44_11]